MKIELKLPPPLKSVAALPCEKLHQRGICYCFMSFYLPICFFLPDAQWRKSVVKSEGVRSVRSNHQTRSRPKFVFVFGAENGILGHFFAFARK